MEEKFLAAWEEARAAATRLGVRMRPINAESAMKIAQQCLSGHRESDGFFVLADKHRLEFSLEALATDKRFGELFTDEQVNNALQRLLAAGYYG